MSGPAGEDFTVRRARSPYIHGRGSSKSAYAVHADMRRTVYVVPGAVVDHFAQLQDGDETPTLHVHVSYWNDGRVVTVARAGHAYVLETLGPLADVRPGRC